MQSKQVIVMRKDLNMRKGKMCAQAAHASMAFLTRGCDVDDCYTFSVDIWPAAEEWIRSSFRKICVYVNSEEELWAVHFKAIDAGLVSNVMTDNGLTEFGGVPTHTCCAIGPHWDDEFAGITDGLPLL